MSALRQLNPRVDSQGIDSIGYAHPIVGKLLSGMYLQMLKHRPQIWDFLYDNPSVEEATREIRDLLPVINMGKIYKLFKSYRPRALVCTQAGPAMVLAALKQRGKIKLPLIGVITDYGVHGYWMSRHIDLYLVPSEDIRRAMIRQGIKESRIQITGIPVDPVFTVRHDKKAERLRLGFHPDLPTVLVMGGSQGLGPTEEVVAALRRLPMKVQVIMVCGSNRSLLKDMNAGFAADRFVRIFGHTRNVPRLMDAADILISKPGGLTCTESLVKGLPLVMIHPIPGQEERNARYLLKHGAAERADTMDQLRHTVQSLLTHRERLEKLRERAAALARPHAAYDAAEAILKTIREPSLARPWIPGERPRAASGAGHRDNPGDGPEHSRAGFRTL